MFRHDLLASGHLGLRDTSLPLFARLVDLVAAIGTRSAAPPRVVAGALWANLHGIAQLWSWGSLPAGHGGGRPRAAGVRRARRVRARMSPLSYRDSGAGPPVVLLHGGASSAATWDRFAAALAAAGRRTIAVDLRGHGEPGPAATRYRFADDVAGLLDRARPRPGRAGRPLARRAHRVAARPARPDRVSHLVLEEPPVPGSLSGRRFDAAGIAAARRRVVASIRARWSRPSASSAVPDPAWSDAARVDQPHRRWWSPAARAATSHRPGWPRWPGPSRPRGWSPSRSATACTATTPSASRPLSCRS